MQQISTAEASSATAPALLRRRAVAEPDTVLIRQQDADRWRAWTATELDSAAARLAQVLVELGVRRGDRIAMFARSRVEVVLAWLAAQGVGAVPFGIFPPTDPEAASYFITDADARVVLCDADAQAAGLRAVMSDGARSYIVLDQPAERGSVAGARWDDLIGDGHAPPDPETARRWAETVGQGSADDISAIYYTSGTTGRPKGVLLSHRNIVSSYFAPYGEGRGMLPAPRPEDRTFHDIPFASAAGPWFGLYHSLLYGCVTHIPADPGEPAALIMAQPTIYLGSPRIWDLRAGEVVRALERGARGPDAVRAALATVGFAQLRYAYSGGGRLAAELVAQWHEWGITLREIYGLTESGGLVSMATDEDPVAGTAGRVIPGMELRLEDGEVLVRGPGVFQGYLNLPEATAEALDPAGWLHTGDLGELSDDGTLIILDRKSELIIMASGTRVMASEIEAELTRSPHVRTALVVGDGREQLTALIEIDPNEVARSLGLPTWDFAELAARADVVRLIEAARTSANDALRSSGRGLVAAIRLLPKPLDLSDPSEATSTRRIRRRSVATKYQDLIEEMYA